MMLPQDLSLCGLWHFHRSWPYMGCDTSTGLALSWDHDAFTVLSLWWPWCFHRDYTFIWPWCLRKCPHFYFFQFPRHLSTHNLHSIPSLLPSPVFSVMKKACLVYHRALSSQTDSYWTLNKTLASIWITIKWPSATDRSPPTQGCATEIPGLACGWGSVSESHSYSFQTLAFFPGTRPAGCEQL